MNTIIKNGIVLRSDFSFHRGDLFIKDGVIVSEAPSDADIIDAENLYIVPGFVDIHFHGCDGHDFCEGTLAAFKAICEYEKSVGVLTICPATMTLPEEKLLSIMRAAKNFSDIAGIYLEGPFISQHKIGAQNPNYIAEPHFDMLERLQRESGNKIKIAAIAPETPNAFSFIEQAKDITRLSLAHTNADFDTAKRAFDSGVRQVTHLFNAMPGINHRNPGPVVAALDNENVSVELICDGVHIHPAVVRNTVKIFGADRVIFISDSMEATGMSDGVYHLGGLKVIKTGNKATLEDGTTIAGSVTNLADCVRVAVKKCGVPLETAIKCASLNPAKAIGLDESLGSIEAGKAAKILALDQNLNLIWIRS
ncbi:MAG: N-acetylglucosamine-6-phosphate deacetylase [Synergistaceae bacterium]|nr:N-acetylglucosamine-6-phosphate deacetylase [Synergistaceae bacterium]